MQDLLMRNQEDGESRLIVAYEQVGAGTVSIVRRIYRGRAVLRVAVDSSNVLNNIGESVNANMTEFNIGPWRFRLGVVFTTHPHNTGGVNQQQPDNHPSQNNHGHAHEHSNVHQHVRLRAMAIRAPRMRLDSMLRQRF